MTKLRASEYQRVLGFAVAYLSDGDQRLGQALFNALRAVNTAAADTIHGTDADPFYDDRNIPAFWTALG